MFSAQNLQINRGSLTANAQGKFVTTLHSYRDDTLTVAAIQLLFPPFLDQGTTQDKIAVGDHMLVLGSDTTTFNKILDLDPFTLGPDLFSGASGLSVGPTIAAVDNNGARILGNILQMERADVTHSGIVTEIDQTFSGVKSFATGIKADPGLDRVTAGELILGVTTATSIRLDQNTTVTSPNTLFTDNIDSINPLLTIGATNATNIDFPIANIQHFMQGNTNVAIGPNVLPVATTASENVGIGFNALAATTTGDGNMAMGEHSLIANTTGQFNVGIGAFTLAANTTGNNQVAVGVVALQANTTGQGNTAVGGGALNANTTGDLNVAVGDVALQFNTTGDNNTALGANAMLTNTTGTLNVAVGSNALRANTTGIQNIAIGPNALLANTTAGASIAIGVNALAANTTANGAVGIGNNALAANTTGGGNTAVGTNALQTNTTSSFNTAVGHTTLNLCTGQQNTAIGYVALNALTTGMGNTAVGHDTLITATTAIDNTALGGGALADLTVATENTAVGKTAGNNITTGNRNTLVGSGAGTNYITESDNIAIKHPGTVADAGYIRIGSAGTHVKNFQAGIRGITTDAADAIAVLISSTGQLGTISSLRSKKENIVPVEASKNADVIRKLNPVRFDYIDSKGRSPQFGLIAEEVAAVYDDICAYEMVDGKEVLKTVYYDRLPIMLLREVQRLQNEVEILKAK